MKFVNISSKMHEFKDMGDCDLQHSPTQRVVGKLVFETEIPTHPLCAIQVLLKELEMRWSSSCFFPAVITECLTSTQKGIRQK